MAIKKKSAPKAAPGSQYKPINPGQLRKWEKSYLSGTMSKKVRRNVEKRLSHERSLANRRLKRLSAENVKSRAYNRALGKIQAKYGQKRKTWGKAKNFDDLIADAFDVNAFLADKTSTIKGAKAQAKEKRDEFKQKWPGVSDGMTDNELDDFLRFLHDDSVSDYFDFFANYEEEIEKMAVLMSEESDKNWLFAKFKQYRAYLEAAKENPFTAEGVTTRELREAISKRYSSKLERMNKK